MRGAHQLGRRRRSSRCPRADASPWGAAAGRVRAPHRLRRASLKRPHATRRRLSADSRKPTAHGPAAALILAAAPPSLPPRYPCTQEPMSTAGRSLNKEAPCCAGPRPPGARTSATRRHRTHHPPPSSPTASTHESSNHCSFAPLLHAGLTRDRTSAILQARVGELGRGRLPPPIGARRRPDRGVDPAPFRCAPAEPRHGGVARLARGEPARPLGRRADASPGVRGDCRPR